MRLVLQERLGRLDVLPLVRRTEAFRVSSDRETGEISAFAGRPYCHLVGHEKADGSETAVYAGRSNAGGGEKTHLLNAEEPGEHGWLGNPFPAEAFGREESVARFTRAFLAVLEQRPTWRRAVAERVAGKTLGCWCQRLGERPPDADLCHAEVVAHVADRVIVRRDQG